jgi:hypothetical protein
MKPSREFRPTLTQTDILEDRKLLSRLKPHYAQRIPVYNPEPTQVLQTPTIPRLQLASRRTYDLAPPPNSNVVSTTGDYKVGGATIVPFGYVYANAAPGNTLVSLSGIPDNGTGPRSYLMAVTTLGQRQNFYATSGTEMIMTPPAMFRAGFVSIGVTPTTYDAGTDTTSSQAGELRILNRVGTPVMILRDTNLINGPIGLTWLDKSNSGSLFVSNGINGTISRFDFQIFQRGPGQIRMTRATQIGGGFTTAGSATTDLQGPTGLSYDETTDTLYIASTLENAVFAIDKASRIRNVGTKGRLVFSTSPRISEPTGVSVSPSRTLLVAGTLSNGTTGIAEFDLKGTYIGEVITSPAGGGSSNVTWNHSLSGFGPEIVTLTNAEKAITFLPIIV